MDSLLKSIGDDAPSGENLEYEPVYAALELAAQPGEERQSGDAILEAEPPNYADVIEKATAVLVQSHDLRAAVHLALAEVNVNGFAGLARATTYIRGCLEQYWETCHPQLDEEDDDDPTMRVNAVLGLSDDATIVRSLRQTPLTQSNAFGRVSLRDIDVANGEATAREGDDRVLDQSAIAAAFKDTPDDVLQGIFTSAQTALEDVKAIDAIFNDKTPGQGPDLSQIQKMLHRAVTRLAEETGSDVEEAAPSQEEHAEAGAPAVAAAVPSGAISSPRDVEAALDRILAYYATYEPSSPLPIILKRAKRLVGADFMTIINDMAPSGMDSVRLVGGLTDGADE
ncbi:type VI secretion system protein TssA [Sulfitobacter sabulilitoris]|uniref:Type VI secretion system protein TssA n=1 Tax=Sulfitobacter sabulilitoris TaxID=2562655 RepID=A0A5S3PNN7_9RHOB|nr:type VI secretion system protein TssA [Sulfitobacter sabulilitoris]TMM54125.1 type VI secretion system protein TssA [Sulfitobacter sabulilitoris]